MKKWVTLPLALALAAAAPVSAFATGLDVTGGVQIKLNGQNVQLDAAHNNVFEYNGNHLKIVNGNQLEINGKVLQVKDSVLDLGTTGTIQFNGDVLIVNGQSYNIGDLLNAKIKVWVNGQLVEVKDNTFTVGGNVFVIVGKHLMVNGKLVKLKDVDFVLNNDDSLELNGTLIKVGGKTFDIGDLLNTTVKVTVNGQPVEVKNNTFTIGGNVFVINGNRLMVNGNVVKSGNIVLHLKGDETLDINGGVLKVGGQTIDIRGHLNAVIHVKVNGKAIDLTGNTFKIGKNVFVIKGHELWINGQLLMLNGQPVVVSDGTLEVNGNVLTIGGLKLDLAKRVVVKLDGKVDDIWNNAQLEFFKDAKTGLEGSYRLLYDENNLYALVTVDGAAKLWKDNKKAFFLSLFYNGDEDDAKSVGYVVVSWPDMKVYVNGEHKGAFKADKLFKSVSVNGDDVVLELKLPYELEGKFLTDLDKFGLSLGLTGVQGSVDAKGKVVIPVVDLSTLKPANLNELILSWLGTLGLNVQIGTGSNGGNTGGTGGTGSTGGNTGGTGSGGTGGTGTGGTGVTITPSPSTGSGSGSGGSAVGGVSDTDDSGVIPSDMPKTGGGGASEWTD